MSETTIGVDEDTRKRFMRLKESVDDADPSLPPQTANSFLNSLMDTWEAVDEGKYSEWDEDRMREIARDEINDNVNPRALE